MPHLIIIDKAGNPIGDPNEGHRTIEDVIADDHTPSGIVFKEPTPELAEAIFKAVEKFKKDNG